MKNIIFLLLFLCVGCRSKEMVALDQIVGKVNNAVANEEGLVVFGSGYLGPYPFQGLDLEYKSKQRVGLKGARQIFLKTVDTILKVVNENEDFAKHLNENTFSSENLLLTIIFSHDDTDRYIGMAIMAHDSISYYLRDPLTFDVTELYKETLHEARQKTNLSL